MVKWHAGRVALCLAALGCGSTLLSFSRYTTQFHNSFMPGVELLLFLPYALIAAAAVMVWHFPRQARGVAWGAALMAGVSLLEFAVPLDRGGLDPDLGAEMRLLFLVAAPQLIVSGCLICAGLWVRAVGAKESETGATSGHSDPV